MHNGHSEAVHKRSSSQTAVVDKKLKRTPKRRSSLTTLRVALLDDHVRHRHGGERHEAMAKMQYAKQGGNINFLLSTRKLFTKEQLRSLFWEGEGDRVLRFIRIALPREATEVYLVGWQVTYRPFRDELRHLVA